MARLHALLSRGFLLTKMNLPPTPTSVPNFEPRDMLQCHDLSPRPLRHSAVNSYPDSDPPDQILQLDGYFLGFGS